MGVGARAAGAAIVLLVCASGCELGGGGSGVASCAKTIPHDDAVEAIAWGCIGPAGGTIQIPSTEPAELVIPAGALAETTQIVVHRRKRATPGRHLLVFEPDGLTFAKPALLRLSHAAGEQPILNVFQSSAGNADRDAGLEITNWERPRVSAYDAASRTWDIELDHFSFVVALFRVQDLAYLVLDLPDWSLRPADIVVTLTTLEDEQGPNWHPGHVGMIRSVQADGVNGGAARVVESTSFAKGSGKQSGVRYITYRDFRNEDNGHLFLGVRRPKGAVLSDNERLAAVTFAQKAFAAEAGYSVLGFGAVGNYSCVGLVEESLDAAGRGMFGNWTEFVGGTPYEVFQDTAPVDHIQVVVGRVIRMPVYIVSAGTKLSGADQKAGFYLTTHYIKLPTGIAVSGLPTGATFERPVGNDEYEFRWTPAVEDLGKSYPLELTFDGVLRDVEGGRRVQLSRKLTLDVLGIQHDFTVKPGRTLGEPGAIYEFHTTVPLSADIISDELVDLATGMAPPAQPFVDHELTILSQGRLLDAKGKPTDQYGISFRVQDTQHTVIQAPDLHWQWRVNYDTPDWRGDLSKPPPPPKP